MRRHAAKRQYRKPAQYTENGDPKGGNQIIQMSTARCPARCAPHGVSHDDADGQEKRYHTTRQQEEIHR